MQHSFPADAEIVSAYGLRLTYKLLTKLSRYRLRNHQRNPVAANSEISSGDKVIYGFTPSLWPSVRLTLGFPLLMFLTLGGHITSPNHTLLITHHQTTQTSAHVHLARFSTIHPFQHHFKSLVILSKIHQYNL